MTDTPYNPPVPLDLSDAFNDIEIIERRFPLLHTLRELYLDLIHDWVAMIGVIGILLFVFMALAAPIVAPYDPTQQSLRDRFVPPMVVEEGHSLHILGTDSLGRDILSRLIHGSRISIALGLLTLAVTATFGTLIGVISGYYGGWVDQIIMSWVDIQTAFPGFLVTITIIAMLGPSLRTLILALSINGWLIFARVVRGVTLSLREQVFVKAARVSGCRDRRIIFVHILPNLISPVLTIGVMELARYILAEAALSFVGLGIQPPASSWGLMLAQGRDYLANAWWNVTFPGVAIALTVLFINLIAGWLRSVSDPHQRGKLKRATGG